MNNIQNEERLNGIIGRLVGNQDATDIKAAYRDWAKTYDADLDGFGYVAPATGVQLFHSALNAPNGLIFDAGCGTGQCGALLTALGYRVHGADFSPDMLAQARGRNVYETLTEADFRQPLDIADNAYAGALSIGVYNSFIGSGFVDELARITKPNGVICLSCRFNFYADDLLPHIKSLERAGVAEIEVLETKPYMTGQDADAAYVVLRKKQ